MPMLVVTTDDLPGYQILRVLGEVIGATGRHRNPFADNVLTLKDGSANPRLSRHLERHRRAAVDDMVQQARKIGANAVVGMRFDHREISQAWGEMCAYGTAVLVAPAALPPPYLPLAGRAAVAIGAPRPDNRVRGAGAG